MDRIVQIRNKFKAELEDCNYKDAFHLIDIERVLNEDWQIRRYLLDSDVDIERPFQKLTKTFLWKKFIGIHEFSEKDFPKELYECCRVEKHGYDYEGSPLLWESTRQHQYCTEYDKLTKLLIAVTMETMDRTAGEKGFVCVIDFTDTPLSNFNIRLVSRRVRYFREHFPRSIKKVLFVNLPYFARQFARILVNFYISELKCIIQYCSPEELQNFIDKKYIHKELKGDREQRFYPEGTLPLRQIYQKFDLTKEFVDLFYKKMC